MLHKMFEFQIRFMLIYIHIDLKKIYSYVKCTAVLRSVYFNSFFFLSFSI